MGWGSNLSGALSGLPTGSDFIAITAGSYSGYALRADGSIAAWGDDQYGQVSGAPTGMGFIGIGAADYTGFALAVPEPTTISLLALAGLALLARRRRGDRVMGW